MNKLCKLCGLELEVSIDHIQTLNCPKLIKINNCYRFNHHFYVNNSGHFGVYLDDYIIYFNPIFNITRVLSSKGILIFESTLISFTNEANLLWRIQKLINLL